MKWFITHKSRAQSQFLMLGSVIMLMCILQGCGEAQSTATPGHNLGVPTFATISRDDTPYSQLHQAVENMSNLSSFHFKGEVTVDDQNHKRIEGDFSKPNNARFTVSSNKVETSIIIFGGSFYAKYPNESSYTTVEGVSELGIITLEYTKNLLKMKHRVEYLNDEEIEGVKTSKFSIIIDETAEMHHDLWVDRSSSLVIRQADFIGDNVEPKSEMTYTRFDEPIVPPIKKP